MSKRFHAFYGEADVRDSFAKEYSLYVGEHRETRGLVKISTTDTTTETTLVAFTPSRAREIALALLDVATHIEESYKVGDEVEAVEHLRPLPVGTILLDNVGSPVQKMPDDTWESVPLGRMAAQQVVQYGPFTILHLPEETK